MKTTTLFIILFLLLPTKAMPLSKEALLRMSEADEILRLERIEKNMRRLHRAEREENVSSEEKAMFSNMSPYQRKVYIETGGFTPYRTEKEKQLMKSLPEKEREKKLEKDIKRYPFQSLNHSSHPAARKELGRRIETADRTPGPLRYLHNLIIPDDQEVPEAYLERYRQRKRQREKQLPKLY